MKRIAYLVTVCFLIHFSASAQHYTQQITNVKEQARKMADALIKKDYNTLMKFINIEGYPKGKLNAMTPAKVLKTIQTVDSQMVKQGIAIKSINFGDVISILKVDFEFQCTIKQITETKMQLGRVITTSTLIGTSNDSGITWKFVDATGRDKIEMKKLMPRLSDKLIFATKEAPKFLTDNK